MNTVKLPTGMSHANILGAATAQPYENMGLYGARRLLSIFWATCPRGECPSDHTLWPSMRITDTTLTGPRDLVDRAHENFNRYNRLAPGFRTDPSNSVHCGHYEPPYRAVSPPKGLPIATTLAEMSCNDTSLLHKPIPRHTKCTVSLKQDGKKIEGACDDVARDMRRISSIALGKVTDVKAPDGKTYSGPFSTWATTKWLSTYTGFPL